VVNRGEVWWVQHPVKGRRPFLVLTRQAVIPVVRRVTVAPATKRVRGIPSELPLSIDDGMPADCVLNFDNLTVLPKSWFVERICQLSPVHMVQACRALAVAMGC
jgi:mRNA interferase MazF